ncbi:TMPRSS6.2 family protein [Megaselia abdita]
MKVTWILVLACALIGEVFAAHSGYFYDKPSKPVDHRLDEPLPAEQPLLAEESQIQGDFPIEDLLSAQKQNIFQSAFESYFKPLGSNVGFQSGSKPTSSNAGVYNPFASSNNNAFGGSNFGTSSFGVNKGPTNRCGQCTCGLPNKNRIVGGTAVRSNKYPWTVQLLQGRNGRLFCGGTLIHEQYVLTAAHCIHGMRWQNIHVRMNQYDRNSQGGAITKSLLSANVHSGYNTNTLENDIAVLKLSEPVKINGDIRPACLPPSETFNVDYKTATVAGWGLTQEQGSTSNILREVDVPVITNAQCRQTKYKTMIKESMLCAGNVQTGGKDACQGDSGGPLIVNDNGYYKLTGVVSFGYGCAKPDAPGVYTRVSKYLKWIYQQTSDGCYCQK